MKLKLILVALCLSLVSLLNISVVMAVENISGDYEYRILYDGTISIIDYSGDETNVVVPETIDGYVVSTIGRAFSNINTIKSIVLPDTITVIDENAFSSCRALKEINIPEGVKSIGAHAFYATQITEIILPDSLEEIGIFAFTACESLKKVEIPEGVKEIGQKTFASCRSLEHVELPDSLVKIGDEAFSRCKILEEIRIPANVETIGTHVFYLCDNLVSIDVDSNNTKFFSYNGALYSKESEENITLLIYPPGLDGGNEYFVYDGTIEIADNAFVECKEVVSVIVPSTVETIGTGAFLSCTSLRSIYLPDSLKLIGTDAFYNCTSLKKIYYEGGIGEWNIVFQYHDELPETEILYNYIRREYPFGDVNGDRQINAVDALMVLQYAAKIEKLSEQSLLSADVTDDAKVNAEDAYYILAYASKIIDKFPGAY